MKIAQIFDVCTPPLRIQPPFVIAEAGVNHEGDMNIARRLIDRKSVV